MTIEEKISRGVVSALKALYGADVEASAVTLGPTKKEFEGDYTLVVFPYLRLSRKKPQETAQEIGEWLQANEPAVKSFNVINGFLNITVDTSFRTAELIDIYRQPRFGFREATPESPLVMVEYSSPNTNKPLHLGHVRNNLLGYSLSRILEANGCRVVKTLSLIHI